MSQKLAVATLSVAGSASSDTDSAVVTKTDLAKYIDGANSGYLAVMSVKMYATANALSDITFSEMYWEPEEKGAWKPHPVYKAASKKLRLDRAADFVGPRESRGLIIPASVLVEHGLQLTIAGAANAQGTQTDVDIYLGLENPGPIGVFNSPNLAHQGGRDQATSVNPLHPFFPAGLGTLTAFGAGLTPPGQG